MKKNVYDFENGQFKHQFWILNGDRIRMFLIALFDVGDGVQTIFQNDVETFLLMTSRL